MSEKASILIVDDEKNTREGLSRALKRKYNIFLADNGSSALDIVDAHPIDVILSDIRMPGMDGISLVKELHIRKPDIICILLTAYGSVETAVEAMKIGAYDFLTKPINLDKLELLLNRSLRTRQIEIENVSLHSQLNKKLGLENIIGESPAMQHVFDMVRQVAPTRATVMIQGESGTGKELIAEAIHRLSPRQYGPYVTVHCAALPENLLESELFGHEKGAFTGAATQRLGRFERAHGGTLFMDEIGEISAVVQVKLLRVLEERCIERVGGDSTIKIDVRLISATNKDLKAMVKDGSFREDLFYRLDVVIIRLPSLRERLEDIPLLAHHFLRQFSEENGKKIDGITPDALAILQRYPWPGNVRELRNKIENMVVMTRSTRLGMKDLPSDIRAAAEAEASTSHGSLEETERKLIIEALAENNGNRTKAAQQLGISRRTLHRKINEFELHDL
ncbi:MAG: sigma-54-dependent Fis family transcriptional regulator [Spartobacteria bacterium]|nr:sigma-54-dependent Fis family transcriptional regulator [Spartobacteria bacterium]